MKDKISLLIIGLGGIGSWLIEEIAECVAQQQISPYVQVTLADGDTAELEQIRYQNFKPSEIGGNKAQILAARFEEYGFRAVTQNIRKRDDLKGHDIIMLCVDNNPTRKLVMEYCHDTGTEFIDLRAEGRKIYAAPKTNPKAAFGYESEALSKIALQDDLDTLDLTDAESGSCQTATDKEQGTIQKGNKIVAMIGAQMLLNLLREQNSQRVLIKI